VPHPYPAARAAPLHPTRRPRSIGIVLGVVYLAFKFRESILRYVVSFLRRFTSKSKRR